MKKPLLLIVFIISVSNLFSQKTSDAYLPEQSSVTPNWFNVFYNGVTNAQQIEDAYNTYYKTHKFEKTAYTQYYKRWMMENERYAQEDGTISKPSEGANNQPSKGASRGGTNRNPTSVWSLIGPTETFQTSWNDAAQPAVPWQVNIYAFDVSLSNPDILYACPETGGIFKTVDKGLNWVSVSDNVRLGTMTAIAINPTNPDIVYAGGRNNIFQTIDGGSTWTTLFTLTNLYCNDISIFPNNPNIIFAAGDIGLYKSVNAGVNFTIVTGFTGSSRDIETNPLRDSTLFILRRPLGDTVFRCYRSYDAGVTFTVQNNGWFIRTSAEGGRMSVTPADTNYLYVAMLISGIYDAPVILRSINGGNSWIRTVTGTQNNLTGTTGAPMGMSNGQGYYDLSIMASTINKNEVIVGTTTTYKSTDTANTFTAIGGYHGNFALHPDVQEMKMIGNDAWIATDGGLNYSPDFYTTVVTARNKGIYGSDYWGYGQGWNEDILTGGRYHNGDAAMYDGYPAGSSLRLGGGEAGTGYGSVGRDMYVAHSDIGAYIMPKTFSGDKSDFTFNLYPNEDGYGWDASEVEFYPSCYNHIYVGKDSGLWKSIDGGVSYSQVYHFPQAVRKFEICRSNPLVMYLATTIKLYKTIDGGVTWNMLTMPAGTSMYEISLSVSYTDESILWITSRSNSTNNKVFKTIDGGATWINLTTATINGFSYFIINHQAGTDGGVYITSLDYAHVFYRNNSMADWVNFSASLPKEYKPISTKPFYAKNKLRTAGNRGIWEVDFYEDGLPVAQPTVDKLESSCIRDTFYFDDFSALNHITGSWQWSFPGATSVSATNIRNPKVTYNGIGPHTATLTVSQNGNSSTKWFTVTVLGNACAADTVPGNALKLTVDGDIASAPPLNLNSNTVTISAWIKPDANQDDWAGVVFCRGGTSCSGISLRNDNEVRYHWDGNFWGTATGLYFVPNEWNHVAVVITPNYATVYVNGIGYTDTGAHAAEAFDAPTIIGQDAWGAGRTFHGLVDEVCIWNRALTQDEIRAMRHLTKNPITDTSLVAYYQFDEASGLILDRAGNRHATLTSGAARVVSTGPFAGGTSSKLNISGGGVVTFPTTDVKIGFHAGGGANYPNGDVWVSKLNVHPDQGANPFPIQDKYWVINNYGSNGTFTSLDSVVFGGCPQLPITTPNSYYLYARSANADGATWGNPQDTADVYSLNGNNSKLKFSTNNNITSFGQFSLNAITVPWAGVQENHSTGNFEVTAYPNPAENELFLELFSNKESKKSSVTIYDMIGKQVLSSKQNIKQGKNIILLNMASLSNGIYIVNVEIDGSKKTKRISVNR